MKTAAIRKKSSRRIEKMFEKLEKIRIFRPQKHNFFFDFPTFPYVYKGKNRGVPPLPYRQMPKAFAGCAMHRVRRKRGAGVKMGPEVAFLK